MLLAAAVLITACGGDDGGGGGGGGGGSAGDEAGTTEGAKVIDPASMQGASGTVKYCTGQDTTGERKDSIKRFEAANPNIQVELVEFPASADEQRNQFIQRQQARSADCDVFGADVVWTAEFAQQKWLYDLTPYIESRKAEFIPSTLETVALRRQVLGRAEGHQRGLPVLPVRSGRRAAGHVAGGVRATRRPRTGSSTRAPRTRA